MFLFLLWILGCWIVDCGFGNLDPQTNHEDDTQSKVPKKASPKEQIKTNTNQCIIFLLNNFEGAAWEMNVAEEVDVDVDHLVLNSNFWPPALPGHVPAIYMHGPLAGTIRTRPELDFSILAQFIFNFWRFNFDAHSDGA